MVHELHLGGHQRLRAVPAMEPSGKHWQCAIAPVSLVSQDHGARLAADVRDDSRIATYTSRDQNRYFAWTDIYPYATPKELAMHFVERFPEVVEAGRGPDWPYAGWYMEMLRLTCPDQFPYAAAKWKVPDTHLPTASPTHHRPMRIALPPPGEASARRASPPAPRDSTYPSSRRAPLDAMRRLTG